jgi:hypothetical protein
MAKADRHNYTYQKLKQTATTTQEHVGCKDSLPPQLHLYKRWLKQTEGSTESAFFIDRATIAAANASIKNSES